ncbi:MAG: 6-bladed beta-propeller [Porphyromonadaceae bacterium]|nr:MAG: 6-bladed beta-propeller [Porphyromonadaceae bacterium]
MLIKNKFQVFTIIALLSLPLIGSAQMVQTMMVGKGLKNEEQVFLKNIAQDVEYICLETTDKCLIGGAGHVFTTDPDNIIIADKVFYRFGRDGKYKNSISGRGKGPGEYVEICGFEIDPATGTFYIFDRQGKILNFKLTGELISDQKVSSGLYANLFDKNKVINLYSSRSSMLSGGYRVVINDLKGNPLRKEMKLDQESINGNQNLTVQNTRLTNFRDSTTVWEGLSDTIYRISKDYQINPRFCLDLGKDRLPKTLPITPNSPDYRKEIDKYIMPIKFFETDRKLYLETSDRGQPKRHLCNKSDGVCITLPCEDLIINDFDGGPDFWPLGITPDGKLYMLFDIVVLKEYWKPNTEIALKYPEKQKAFLKMLESCKEDDNPIIMLVTPIKN